MEGQAPPAKASFGSGAWAFAKSAVGLILSQWLLIGMGVVCVLAYYFPRKNFPLAARSSLCANLVPDVAAHGGTIRSEYSVVYGAVSLIFLVSGMQLSPAKIKENVTNWRLHLIVQGMSFAISPLIALGSFTLHPRFPFFVYYSSR